MECIWLVLIMPRIRKSLKSTLRALVLVMNTSGIDQGEEGKFVWMSTGKPLGWENWNAGEPNNYEYEGGEREHCLELWNRDGKGLKWNDSPCSFETYFICEV